MTFAQQVADGVFAILDASWRRHHGDDVTDEEALRPDYYPRLFAGDLAPRVAAAIDAAMDGCYWCSSTHHHAPANDSGEKAALEVLRGSVEPAQPA